MMAYFLVIAFYVLVSLYFKWLLSWGSAEKMEGWLAVF